MLTDNYYTLVQVLMTNQYTGCILKDLTGKLKVLSTDFVNSERTAYTQGTMMFPRANYLNANGNFYNDVRLGSNGTAATRSDYKVTDVSGVTLLDSAVTGEETGQNFRVTTTHTVKNTGTAAVTIREVGYSVNLQYLVARCVLDTPMTLQPNEAGVIRVTTEFPGLGRGEG